MRPATLPIGLQLNQAARIVGRAFDDALAGAGGSLPLWLILLNLKTRRVANQRELARAVGVSEATLTNHLNGMEARGLLTRRRDPANRRMHQVELTAAGEKLFLALRGAAQRFDRRLRRGLDDAELGQLAQLLDKLVASSGGRAAGPPWMGAADTPPRDAARRSRRR